MAFISQLARRHDALATVKNGALIFASIGSGATPSGKALPSIEIRRDMTSGCRWTRQKRDEHEAIEAKWHDKKSGKRNTVKVGSGDNVRTLKRIYSTEADARQAATIELQLALGDASLNIDQPVQLRGFKSDIDASSWQIAEISHSIGARGFVTSLLLDTAAP